MRYTWNVITIIHGEKEQIGTNNLRSVSAFKVKKTKCSSKLEAGGFNVILTLYCVCIYICNESIKIQYLLNEFNFKQSLYL